MQVRHASVDLVCVVILEELHSDLFQQVLAGSSKGLHYCSFSSSSLRLLCFAILAVAVRGIESFGLLLVLLNRPCCFAVCMTFPGFDRAGV
jgi:hypothetical protein